jgi:hypothetical protein
VVFYGFNALIDKSINVQTLGDTIMGDMGCQTTQNDKPDAVEIAGPARERLRGQIAACGFDLVGFSAADPPAAARKALAEWIAAGYAGQMRWMEKTALGRARWSP